MLIVFAYESSKRSQISRCSQQTVRPSGRRAGRAPSPTRGEEWRADCIVALCNLLTVCGLGVAARFMASSEFALLLDLKDVYWARQGRISVDIGIGGIALAGCYFAALPVLRRLRKEHRN